MSEQQTATTATPPAADSPPSPDVGVTPVLVGADMAATKIVNLTSHDIEIRWSEPDPNLIDVPGEFINKSAVLSSEGFVYVTSIEGDELPPVQPSGIPRRTATRFTSIVGLPDPVPGTIYIVPAFVAQMVARDDVYSADFSGSPAVEGKVKAATRLIRSTPNQATEPATDPAPAPNPATNP